MNFSAANPGKRFFRKLVSSPGDYGLAAFNRNDQITYLVLTALAVFTLSLARWLTPSTNGFGTHTQLGLPPCVFFKLTGIPCPTCGLTTSFAHSARLHFHEAFITQPFGVLLFSLTAFSIPLFIVLLRRRIAWSTVILARGVDWLIYFLIAAGLAGWLYKIAVVKSLFN